MFDSSEGALTNERLPSPPSPTTTAHEDRASKGHGHAHDAIG